MLMMISYYLPDNETSFDAGKISSLIVWFCSWWDVAVCIIFKFEDVFIDVESLFVDDELESIHIVFVIKRERVK